MVTQVLSLAKTLFGPKNDAMLRLPWREELELDQDLLSGATLLLAGNVRVQRIRKDGMKEPGQAAWS
jgi:hypothetical protein